MTVESNKGKEFWCNTPEIHYCNSAALDSTAVFPKTYTNADKSTASTSLECNRFAFQQGINSVRSAISEVFIDNSGISIGKFESEKTS